MGGVGKTRIAAEVAARVSQNFEQGTFVVTLAETPDSEPAFVSELRTTLGGRAEGFVDEMTAVREMLRSWNALVVLDNFEAVSSATRFVGRLLVDCPRLHILVTSQTLLGLAGEQQIEVAPMLSPADKASASVESLGQLEAFKLFRDRAKDHTINWEVAGEDASVIAEILGLTDGVPLSIELAATWVDRLPLQALRDGLKRNRSRILSRSGPGVEVGRHASIEACLEWSYGLLSADEQRLLVGLSVFAGGFFSSDVGPICEVEDPQTLLDKLRGRSLVFWEEAVGQPRYRMLPTVREYAARKLGDELGDLRRRHAEQFHEVLARAGDQIRGTEQLGGLRRIAADLDNIRKGFQTAIREADLRLVVKYAEAFGVFLLRTARVNEALDVAQSALIAARSLNDSHQIALCQNNLGIAYSNLPTGDRWKNLEHAIGCFEAALRVHTEHEVPDDWARIQVNLGNACAQFPTGNRGRNLNRAIGCFEAALRVYTDREFPIDWARTQASLGIAYTEVPTGNRGKNLGRGIGCFEAALRVYTERVFPLDWANTQSNLGTAYAQLPTGDPRKNLGRAIGCFEAALRVRTEREFPVDWATTQLNLGIAYTQLPTGDPRENLGRAIGCFEAALRVRTERESPAEWANIQACLGSAYAMGIAYRDSPTGDRGESLRRAIGYQQAAIRAYESVGLRDEAQRLRDLLSLLRSRAKR
jgi:predicted ATPase